MQQKSNRTDERVDYTKRYEDQTSEPPMDVEQLVWQHLHNEPTNIKEEKKNYGVVDSSPGLYLRDEPNGKVRRILADKTKLELISRTYDWYYVSCEDGFKGYVMADYILQMVD